MSNALDFFATLPEFEDVLFRADDKAENYDDGDFVDNIIDRWFDADRDVDKEIPLSNEEASRLRSLAGDNNA